MKNIQSAGGIVVGSSNCILIVRNTTGSFTLPKGSVKKNEPSEKAARREIYEETGLVLPRSNHKLGTIKRPGFTIENSITPTVIKHIDIYLYFSKSTDLKPNKTDVSEAIWVKPDKVIKTLTHKQETEFVKEHLPKLGLRF